MTKILSWRKRISRVARDSRKPFASSDPGNVKKFRPNFARQMLYAAIALASVLAGYYLVLQFAPHKENPAVQTSDVQIRNTEPWYKKQNPPPSLITTPDAPLFPEHEEGQLATNKTATETATTKRAYEEALPKEIYDPPPLGATTVAAPETVSSDPVETETTNPTELPHWRQYAVAVPESGKDPLIAIVIDDMGVDQIRSARAINLQGPLTLSFLTYARDLARQTDQARSKGHELMLHVSMEPTSATVDPGPNVLLTGLDDAELMRRLDWGFSRFTGYVGVNNHMGSKFTADRRGMQLVVDALKRRGLLFLDSRTSVHTVGAKLAKQAGVPLAERNIFIDHVNKRGEVNARLAEVEKLARRKGFAVAIGHPRQVTIDALEIWLADVQSRGFRLVPISTIVEKFGAS